MIRKKIISFNNMQEKKVNWDTSRFGLLVLLSVFLISILYFGLFGSQYLSYYVYAQTTNDDLDPTTTFPSSSNTNLSLTKLIEEGSPYFGSSSAPITIIDFSDLQCPLCKRHVDNTEPQINSTYVQDGKVAYVFKHLANRGIDSFPAALAAQCTNDQGKFWEYHNILFMNQGPIDSGWANSENLQKFATQIPGMNMTQFDTCVEGKKYEEFIRADMDLANSLELTATPSFIISNSDGSDPLIIEGPKPFPIFKDAVDKLSG